MFLAYLGQLLLALSLPTAAYSSALGMLAARENSALTERRAAWARTASHIALLLMAIVLEIALLANRFELSYVSRYSSITLPLPYKIAAFWGGMEGSLLFWAAILALAIHLMLPRLRMPDRTRWLTAALLQGVLAFFLMVMLFAADPFRLNNVIPPDGRGLNPLLQNPLMVIHPPTLLAGYVTMVLPCAIMIAALWQRDTDDLWLPQVRRWILLPWLLLTVGNALGSMWAYAELGWGGFWGWDPVENAAIIPWFIATAFLHSAQLQRQFGSLRRWNIVLVFLAFWLTILGTFLNRSGVVQSVHAFSDFALGNWFLVFLIALGVGMIWLMIVRRDQSKSNAAIIALYSRENALMLGSVLLVIIGFGILWGTLFPLVSDAIVGKTITVEKDFYNKLLAPLGIIVLWLMAIGPWLPWRGTTLRELWQAMRWPIAGSALAGIVLFICGWHSWFALCSVGALTFIIIASKMEGWSLVRALQRSQHMSFWHAYIATLLSQQRRMAAHMVHFGVALLFIAFTGCLFQEQHDLRLKVGESAMAGSYRVTLTSFGQRRTSHHDSMAALLELHDADGTFLAKAQPAYNFYRSSEQPTNEIAIMVHPLSDLYIVLGGYDAREGWAEVRVMINPLMSALWLGCIVMSIGGAWLLYAANTKPKNSGIAISVRPTSIEG